MAGLKRTDNKGRILKDGETQRKDGTYRFTYTDADGVRHDVYSKRLVPTDRLPPGCKDDLCLREKERKINRDLEDGIKAAVENKATLNDLFELYAETSCLSSPIVSAMEKPDPAVAPDLRSSMTLQIRRSAFLK